MKFIAGAFLVLVIGAGIADKSGTTATTADRPTTFVQVVKSHNTDLTASDADIIAAGRQVCVALDAGNSLTDVLTASTATDYPFFVGAAIAAFCPAY